MGEPTERVHYGSEDLFKKATQLIHLMRDNGVETTEAKGIVLFAAVLIAKMNHQTLAQLQGEVESIFSAIRNDSIN